MAEMKSHLGPRGVGLALVGLVAVALLASGAWAQRQPGRAGPGPRVVASTTVLADLARQVGGERLGSVQSVVPAGVDVEDYEPRPEDLQAVAQANLLVMNGLALDRWVPKLIEAARPDLPTLVLSEGLPVLGAGTSENPDIAQYGNPHFWLDPQYAKEYVHRIH